MFSILSDRLEGAIKKIRGQGALTEENVSEALREVRRAFLEADVHFTITKEFVNSVKEKALGKDVLLSVSPGQQIVKIIHDELVRVLGGDRLQEPLFQGKQPYGILICGLQGSGKTTFCGKLAYWLRTKKKRNPLLVAADIYRPAAIKQLQVIGKSLGIPVFEQGQIDPVKIVTEAMAYAKENGHDVVLFDTAGRLQIDEELMNELNRVQDTVKAQDIYLVADAMMGQESVSIAETFHQRLKLTGVCLSKLDGDTRGGAALSILNITGVPIRFAGVGEKPTDLELFQPERMAGRILGMGDVVSLVERAQEVIDEKEARSLTHKLMNNKFDLNDFLSQLRTMKKMGPLKDLLGMIPGMKALKGVDIKDKDLLHVEAVLSSMTLKERKNPKILDASRRKRIAAGSGTSVQKVNQVMRQFDEMKKMMKQFSSMAGKKMPGMKKR
jgi:signal recognition particle subunit SRP54